VNTFRLKNLGCKVNQYEGEAVAQLLEAAGLTRIHDGDGDGDGDGGAGVVLVNTCTVTASAVAKGRKAIRAERRASPGAKLVVSGCMTENNSDELDGMPEVDIVLPNRKKGRLLAALGLEGPGVGQDELALERPTERTRAYVRVQDGCEQRCSYCILPDVRGPERSRPPGSVIDEVGRLAAAGVGEIVLCGIHLGRYGKGATEDGGGGGGGECDLTALVRRALELTGEFRLRLSSVEIGEVTDELARMMGTEPRLASHLHLPVQSGSDQVLEAIRRPYTRSEFLSGLERIRERAGDIGVTTDVIVGFPGETEEDFAETVSCLQAAGPHRVHRFVFSAREGTPAARMENAVGAITAQWRMDELAGVCAALTEEYASARIGTELEVLAEPGREPGAIEGYSSEYLRVRVEPPPPPPPPPLGVVGTRLKVRPERLDGTVLIGPVSN